MRDFDARSLKTLPPGSVYSEPGSVDHNHFARTDTDPVIVEISGYGPTDTHYFEAVNGDARHLSSRGVHAFSLPLPEPEAEHLRTATTDFGCCRISSSLCFRLGLYLLKNRLAHKPREGANQTPIEAELPERR